LREQPFVPEGAVERAMVAIRRRQTRRALAGSSTIDVVVLGWSRAPSRLLERGADQRDGRRSLLALTPAGRDELEAVHRSRQAVFAQAMADWSVAEREQLAALLSRFLDALSQRPRA
jgi:hypothetical protein